MKKINKLKPSKAGQIGMVVRDINRTVKYFSHFYNIKPWFRVKFTEINTFYRGKPINLDPTIAIAFCGGVEIELIQMNNNVENLYSEILNKQGGGIHHIGFATSNYDRALSTMKAMGAEPIQWGRLKTKGGAVTRYVYFDTVKTCGVITEFIETKFFGIPMPHSQFIMRLSSITGDVVRIKL